MAEVKKVVPIDEVKKVVPIVEVVPTVKGPLIVTNILDCNVNLESGILRPNEQGVATSAELSVLSGKAIELVA